jgi:hypothetical protein
MEIETTHIIENSFEKKSLLGEIIVSDFYHYCKAMVIKAEYSINVLIPINTNGMQCSMKIRLNICKKY